MTRLFAWISLTALSRTYFILGPISFICRFSLVFVVALLTFKFSFMPFRYFPSPPLTCGANILSMAMLSEVSSAGVLWVGFQFMPIHS